jgi:hypothetical protein
MQNIEIRIFQGTIFSALENTIFGTFLGKFKSSNKKVPKITALKIDEH